MPATDAQRIAIALMRFRVELYAAAQLFKGDDLKEFTALIREIAAVLNVVPIGEFPRVPT